uniref:hypothetical protein n=1 Tax=Amycolatopsis sp. CA-293810 TaxID=3239926 RepID=UPI003F49762B
MVVAVVVEVAALAEGDEVVFGAVLRDVVAVRGGQHDLGPGSGRGRAVAVAAAPVDGQVLGGAAAFTAAFAAAAGAFEPDAVADHWPVGRVAVPVLRMDRHGRFTRPGVADEPHGTASALVEGHSRAC